jgi:hypothetical protein
MLITAVAFAAIAVAVVQYQRAELLSMDKYFDIEYDPIRRATIGRWKEDGTISSIAYDLSGDLQFDSVVTFGREGRKSSISLDANYDGYYELFYAFDQQDQLVHRYRDADQDGYFEEELRYIADSVIFSIDRNEDGHFLPDERVSAAVRTDRSSEY